MGLATLVTDRTETVKRICELAHFSQPLIARHLNTSEYMLQMWEAGHEAISGVAPKSLAVVTKHRLIVCDCRGGPRRGSAVD